MKIKVTREQVKLFYLNAQNEIRVLTINNKRSRYTGVLQVMLDQLEIHYKAIERRVKYLSEKFATLDEKGDLVYVSNGQSRELSFKPEQSEELDKELIKYLEEVITIEIEEFILSKNDIPKNADQSVRIANGLVKVFYPFVFTKDLHDELLYGELKKSPAPKQPSNK